MNENKFTLVCTLITVTTTFRTGWQRGASSEASKMGFGGGKLETGTREGRRHTGLACSPWLGRQTFLIQGGSQERAGGTYAQMVGVHFGCAEGGEMVCTGRCPPGRAAADQRAAIMLGEVNAYHLSATCWGLVLFPRFGRLRRAAAWGRGGGGRRPAPRCPTVFFQVESQSKKRTPKSRLFSKVQS